MSATKTTKDPKSGFNVDFGGNMGGLLGGLGDFIRSLADLAEKGAELKKSGHFDLSDLGAHGSKPMKGVYGFSVKMGGLGGDDSISVEPFGNIQKDSDGQTVVQDVFEPIVDVFEEQDHVLVVAELPGVDEKDIQVEVKDDILCIHGERAGKKYHKEVLLPCQATREKVSKSCRNGVLEVKIGK
jgi:HSP20 family protein